jgi:hypothetical protein
MISEFSLASSRKERGQLFLLGNNFVSIMHFEAVRDSNFCDGEDFLESHLTGDGLSRV